MTTCIFSFLKTGYRMSLPSRLAECIVWSFIKRVRMTYLTYLQKKNYLNLKEHAISIHLQKFHRLQISPPQSSTRCIANVGIHTVFIIMVYRQFVHFILFCQTNFGDNFFITSYFKLKLTWNVSTFFMYSETKFHLDPKKDIYLLHRPPI